MKAITNSIRFKRGRKVWVRGFLETLKHCGNITQAARFAGVTKDTVQKSAKLSPTFAAAMKAALSEASDGILAEAQRRAIAGVDEPVIYKGQISGIWVDEVGHQVTETTPGARFIPMTVKKCSDMILALLLRARVPGFREESATTVNNNIRVEVAVDDVLAARTKVLEWRKSLEKPTELNGQNGTNGKHV